MKENEMGRNVACTGEKISVSVTLVDKPVRKETIWKTWN